MGGVPVLGAAITLLLATQCKLPVYLAGAVVIALSAAAVFVRRVVK